MPVSSQSRGRAAMAAKYSVAEGWGEKAEEAGASRNEAFRKAILAIPVGKVNSYGGVAAAAGFPRYHRFVARMLREDRWDQLPWHRVVGADGAIKTSGVSAREQRARLRLEGVKFIGDRVDMKKFLLQPGNRQDAEE